MKHLKIIALVSILALISVDSFGFNRRWRHRHHWSNSRPSNEQPVGAPLDGGLLAILAVAGAGYFVARKKKKSGEA